MALPHDLVMSEISCGGSWHQQMTFSIHFLTLFQKKENILPTIFSYATVAALILLLIIILPCIVRTLQQKTQKLVTELHLAVFKNKKGGYAGSHHGRSHPWKGHVEKPWWARRIMAREIPWICSSIYPQTRICLSYYFVPFTNSSDINRGLSLTTFIWKRST